MRMWHAKPCSYDALLDGVVSQSIRWPRQKIHDDRLNEGTFWGEKAMRCALRQESPQIQNW